MSLDDFFFNPIPKEKTIFEKCYVESTRDWKTRCPVLICGASEKLEEGALVARPGRLPAAGQQGAPVPRSRLGNPCSGLLQDAPCPRSNSADACGPLPGGRATLRSGVELCGRVARTVHTTVPGMWGAGDPEGSDAPGRGGERAVAAEWLGRRSGEQPEGAPPRPSSGSPGLPRPPPVTYVQPAPRSPPLAQVHSVPPLGRPEHQVGGSL